MSLAGSPRQSPVHQRCARCGLSLENASLLLVCEHNLCLHCAAQLLESRAGTARRQHVVECKVCRAVTEVDYPAASYLENLLSPSTTRLPCGSEGSTHMAAASACLDSPAARTVSHASDDGSLAVLPTILSPQAQGPSVAKASNGLAIGQACTADSTGPFCWSSNIGTDKLEGKQVRATGQKCGQCEELAGVFCAQCEEVFCSNCATSAHRLGRMARHSIQQLQLARPCPSPCASGEKLRSLSMLKLQPLSRIFHACPDHPEEPLNYFCVECQTECICAECCLHGKHRGHRVQRVLEAASSTTKNVEEIGAALCAQEDSLKSMLNQIQERRLELARALADGQQDIHAALQRACVAVRKEEVRWLQDAEESFDMSVFFPHEEAEVEIGEMQRQLSMFLKSGDPAQALAWFAKLKEALALPAKASYAGDALQRLRARQSHFSEKCLALQQATERLALVQPQLSAESAMPPLLRSSSERDTPKPRRMA